MLYKQPFVPYLNISLCLVLLFLALPTLLNRKEDIKVRVSFFLIYFAVIVTCLLNLLIFFKDNYKLTYFGYIFSFFSVLFGPLIYYYIKNLLESRVSKGILLTLIPGFISVGYGVYLIFTSDKEQQRIFNAMLNKDHFFYEVLNLFKLILALFYCAKSWLFINDFERECELHDQMTLKLKLSWAKEFVVYMFVNILIFLVLVLVLTNYFNVNTLNMDLIGMPIFMLIVYFLVAIRSMMMYKEFEYQVVLTKFKAETVLQEQRIQLSRDLHDSLGAQLTFTSSILDSIRNSENNFDQSTQNKLNKLSEFSENSIAELKSVLWVLNTEKIFLIEFKARLLNLIKDVRESQQHVEIEFNFEIIQNLPVSGKVSVNLFRVIQELINNMLKHSLATHFSINIKQSNNLLFLLVTDNGCGFNWEKEKFTSFGLINIHNRIIEIQGQVEVITEENKGTIFSIQIPLTT